jgi:hypothetical protein
VKSNSAAASEMKNPPEGDSVEPVVPPPSWDRVCSAPPAAVYSSRFGF